MKIPQSGLPLDNPAWPLLQAEIAYWGITSGNGNAGGTTLVCADLDNHPTYVNGIGRVKILTGGAWGQDSLMVTHAVGGIITVANPFTNAAGGAQQILAGIRFVIMSSTGGGGGGGGSAAPTEGIYAHPNGVAEGTAFTIAIAALTKVNTIVLDLTNLTQNATIRVRYDMAGGGLYPIMETFNWTVGMNPLVYFRGLSVMHSIRLTVQSAVAEGAARNIPYEYS